MAEKDRNNALGLMRRLNESGQSKVMVSTEYPQWLVTAVSQILALTGDDEIVTCGHDLTDYDFSRVLDDSADTAEGKIQVLTENLLVVSEFAAPNQAKTVAIPLREVSSIAITAICHPLLVRDEGVWPNCVTFEVELGGNKYSFPVAPGSASGIQHSEATAALNTVKAALL